jgi:RNA recognition motif-containing protein
MDAFGQAGFVVSAALIIDEITRRSRGFGFVEMANNDYARAAIDMWNNEELDEKADSE